MDSTGQVHPAFERALAQFDEVEAQYRADRERVLEDAEARQRELDKISAKRERVAAENANLPKKAERKPAAPEATEPAENPWPVHRSKRGKAGRSTAPETTERTPAPRRDSWSDATAPKTGRRRVSDDDYFSSTDWFGN
ncbi:hypothetical protein [Amycolatopsis sp. CA-230715]|uniref:hypothetical protein n=1 Tax=Amycolatopsis sp. CA-230715 TaxID=2745196 RepID=UPI001C025623|nr:hypothetical protein [Amycolatopsis sp. CA-230715]QWF79617.1 hypothetical protein HUW46_03026 [Amycolatopsis sp. CA-230715]